MKKGKFSTTNNNSNSNSNSNNNSKQNAKNAKKKALEIVNRAIKLNCKSNNSSSKQQVITLIDEALVISPDLIDAVYNKAIVLLELYEINIDDNNTKATTNTTTITKATTNDDTKLFEFSNTNIDLILLQEAYSLLMKVIVLDTSKRSETLGLTYRALSLMMLQHYHNLDQYKYDSINIINDVYYNALNDSIKNFTNTINILTNDNHLDEMILEYSQEILESFTIYYNNNKLTDSSSIDRLIMIVNEVIVIMDQGFQTNVSNDVDTGLFSTKANIFIVVIDAILNSNCDSNTYSSSNIIALYNKALTQADIMLQLGSGNDVDLISLACDVYEKLIKIDDILMTASDQKEPTALVIKMIAARISCLTMDLGPNDVANVVADLGDSIVFLVNRNKGITMSSSDSSILHSTIIKLIIICGSSNCIAPNGVISFEDFDGIKEQVLDAFMSNISGSDDDSNRDNCHLNMALLCYELAAVLILSNVQSGLSKATNEDEDEDDDDDDDDDDSNDDDDDDSNDDDDDDTILYDIIYNIACIHWRLHNKDSCYNAILTLYNMNKNSDNDNNLLLADLTTDKDLVGLLDDDERFNALFNQV